jgi:hypothetical protein
MLAEPWHLLAIESRPRQFLEVVHNQGSVARHECDANEEGHYIVSQRAVIASQRWAAEVLAMINAAKQGTHGRKLRRQACWYGLAVERTALWYPASTMTSTLPW